VDWVIEMRRFEQEALFDHLAAAGRLDLALMEPLGEEIALFHDESPIRPDRGGAQQMARVIDGNAVGLWQFGSGILDSGACASLTASTHAALRRCEALLESRRGAGLVRHCHGDLHLGNIVLFEGRPTLFDAIEFNDDIACIDVMYDLSFLLMDLWHRGLARHANALFNAYLAATQDLDSLAALPLFLSIRAAIRAKTAATGAGLQRRLVARRDLQAAARHYLAMARGLLEPSAPVIVAVGGLSGSGKSALAGTLAPFIGRAPGAVVLRSDEIRKRLCGVPALTRLEPFAYTPEMSMRVYEALVTGATAVAHGGQSAIVDAVFVRAEDRHALERAAAWARVPLLTLWLDAPETVLLDRISQRGPDASDADAAVVRMQLAQWSGFPPWPAVDATGDAASVYKRARASLQAQKRVTALAA
jgi:predicted kinase